MNHIEKYRSLSQSQGEKGEKKYTGLTVKNNIDGVFSENGHMMKNFRKDDDDNDNYNDINENKGDNNNSNNDDHNSDDDLIIIIDSDSDIEIQEDSNSNNNNKKGKKSSKLNNFQNNLRRKNKNVESPIEKFSSFKNISEIKKKNEIKKFDMILNDDISIRKNKNINANNNENENENNVFKSRIILIEDTPHLLQRLFNTDNNGVKRGSGNSDISDQNNR